MGIALKAENVAIRYITGDFKDIGLKEYVVRKLKNDYHVNEFYAVDGVSFELEDGDMLGIVGTNGAGKSTLLKAISGIMEPTRGRITANGNIAALLELGSGFDGDLTVKENAYLRGAMLGYTKEFMDSTYEQIIDFAELREFQERPFKQLSSGMKSRLAFSIASLVRPDILILDEVLSVGDGSFQEKSAKKMREIIGQGATTILVSHSISQVRELCNKILWLDHGKQIAFGPMEEICDLYEQYLRGEIGLPTPANQEVKGLDTETSEDKIQHTPQKAKHLGWKAVVACLVAALFFGTMFASIAERIIPASNAESTISITAKPDTGAVTYRGAEVDGVWYSPSSISVSSDGWVRDDAQDTFTATGQEPMVLHIPSGQTRTVVFNVGPDEGVAVVTCGDQSMEYNLKEDTDWEFGWSFEIPSNTMAKSVKLTIGAVSFALLFILFVLLCRVKGSGTVADLSGQRELWGDFLRGLCSFIIVLLHATCGKITAFDHDVNGWIPYMLVDSFTAVAVPCFYMLSGAYLLRREHSVRETLTRRIPNVYIPLLAWGVLYLLMSGTTTFSAYGKLLFQNQEVHLWFMYSIINIYILLPLISKAYCAMGTKAKVYALCLLLVIPACLHDYWSIRGTYGNMPRFALFWPDLGLFVLGAFLWDQRERLCKRKKWLGVAFVGGLAITGLLTLYVSRLNGTPNKSFISCIGSIGVIIMAVSLFGLGLSLDSRLRTSGLIVRKVILIVGRVSMGVYFAHIAVMQLLTQNEMLSGYLYWNRGGIIEMLSAAIVVYVATLVICWSGKKIPIIRKLF